MGIDTTPRCNKTKKHQMLEEKNCFHYKGSEGVSLCLALFIAKVLVALTTECAFLGKEGE